MVTRSQYFIRVGTTRHHIALWRRGRSGHGHELYRGADVSWFSIWWGSPTRHAWWAGHLMIRWH